MGGSAILAATSTMAPAAAVVDMVAVVDTVAVDTVVAASVSPCSLSLEVHVVYVHPFLPTNGGPSHLVKLASLLTSPQRC